MREIYIFDKVSEQIVVIVFETCTLTANYNNRQSIILQSTASKFEVNFKPFQNLSYFFPYNIFLLYYRTISLSLTYLNTICAKGVSIGWVKDIDHKLVNSCLL
jgi:hypothetical protein